MEPGVAGGVYSIAACSDAPLPVVTLGVFEQPAITREVWHSLEGGQTPAQLVQEIAAKQEQLAASTNIFEENARHITNLEQALEEKTRHASNLEREIGEKARHATNLERDWEEKTRHIGNLERVAEENARHIADLKRASEEKTRHVVNLEREREEKSRHVESLQKELEEKARQIGHYQIERERLHFEAQLAEEKLARASNDLSELRWELLAFRGNAVGGNYSHGITEGTLDAINRADVAESELASLRAIIVQLQRELENVREALDSTTYKLGLYESRVKLLLNSPANALILPFSSPHRKLRRLTKALNGA
jgi:DNA repair exonuclease SbcCD ATPase subunit